jgi:hypothetical protein
VSNKTLSNGFSDLAVPVCDGGTNDTDALALRFNGIDQGAKGVLEATGSSDGAITAWARVNDASRGDFFRLRPTASGYKALPAALTIDGVTVQPAIRLEAGDATTSTWTDVVNGNAFAIAGSGSDPTIDEKAPGIDCKRVKFNAGKRYEAASSSVGAIGTNDFVLEFIVQANTTGNPYFITRTGSAGLAETITVYIFTGSLKIYMAGSSVAVDCLISTLTDSAAYHVILFADRSGNLRAYVNGTASSATAINTLSAINLAASANWALGAAAYSGTAPFSGGISYFSLWHRASWLATADYAGVAAERFARCCGVYAGTAQDVNPGFLDLDMEAADAASWTAGAGATLSKQSGTRTGGSGSLVLRVAGDGSTAGARASQTRAGRLARATGWARSNGTATPTVGVTGTAVWTGTTSTAWQYFDVLIPDSLTAGTRLDLGIVGATGHAEFDDVTIETDGAIPTTQSRTTIAHLEKWNTAGTESYLIPVGANWMRTDKIKCADGTFKTGVRIENVQTNRMLYSEDLSNAAWDKTRVTLGTPVVALGSLSFDAIIASADNNTHFVRQAVVTAASESHAFSVYAKRGGANSIKIELAEDTTQYAYYNLETGTVGATGAGFTLSQPAKIYDMGNSYYRCEFRPTTAGATATIRVYTSNGSTVGSEVFAGNGTATSCWLSGFQFERYISAAQQCGSLTSYIKTTSAAVTRVKDTLTFHGYENCGGKATKNVTAKIDYVCPVYVSGYTGYRAFASLTAKSTNDRIELLRDTAAANALAFVAVGGSTQANLQSVSSLLFDRNSQTIELCAAKNNVGLVLGRALDAADTSADLPELLEIVVGASTSYASQLDGIITDLQLSPYGTVYPRAIFGLNKDEQASTAFVGYDALDADALTYELRAGAGTSGLPTMNGGVLNAGDWHLISLEWTDETEISLKVDGVEVDSATANATIAELSDLFIAWAGLKGYIYEPLAGDPDYSITFGAVSVADVQHHAAPPPAEWYTETLARGVPTKHEHLIHQISQTADPSGDHLDFLAGTVGTRTDEGGPAYVPPTEIGLPLGAPAANHTIIDFGSGFAFMGEASHSYDAWIRVDGSGNQCIWSNGDMNTTDLQALIYDGSTGALVYGCVVGTSLRSVSAAIELDRLYHVAITRDYDSVAGETTIAIYLDGAPVEIRVRAGAPVVTNDNFVMLSASESGGVFTLPFIGATVGNRFYDDALTAAEIEAIYAADSVAITNGPYATQTITPATLPATISGAIGPDVAGGYPIVLAQEEDGGEWRAIATATDPAKWTVFSKQTPLNAIRLYTKTFNTYEPRTSYFDALDGGTDPGDYQIDLVEVAENKRKALENIVLMRKPLHSWAVMVVRYV